MNQPIIPFYILFVLLTHVASGQWSTLTTPGYSPRQAICVIDEMTVYAGGNDGKVWKSTDGGASFTVSPTDTTKSILGMSFLNRDTGFVCGMGGKIFRTNDGGATWSPSTSGTQTDLNDIEFITPSVAFCVGNNGTIRKTTNGGSSWFAHTSGTSLGLLAIEMISPTEGFIVGSNGTILHTTNGITWSSQAVIVNSSLTDVHTADGITAYACGTDARFLRTLDGGLNWNSFYLDSTYSDLYAIDFLDNDTGRAAGQYGRIFHTTDGGNNWTLETGVTGSLILDLKIQSGCSAYAGGTGGVVIRESCNLTGLSENMRAESLRVFPNPATDFLRLMNYNGTAIKRASVTDPAGHMLITVNGSSIAADGSLDIHEIANGIYLLQLESADNMEVVRFIKN